MIDRKSKTLNNEIPLNPFKKGGISTDHGLRTTDHGPRTTGFPGIALVAVLAILVVLAILASVFIITTNQQSKISQTSINAMKAELLAQSGFQHALSLIQNDCTESGVTIDSPETDSQLFSTKYNQKWHIVKNNHGEPIGRYKIEITDECGKLNVNTIIPIARNAMLVDKQLGKSQRNNPLFSIFSPRMIKKVRDYQYGGNRVPGMRNIDDNNNNVTLENDGIDNNFNGIIDEKNEGIDEPDEYNTLSPTGDDRTINSISEFIGILNDSNTKLNGRTIDFLSKQLTTFSISRSPTSFSKEKQVCINGANVRELARAIRAIKTKKAIGKKAEGVSRIVCNIMDYRDENHTLSTHAGSYGIEAVCFNEIMANDGSHLLHPHWINYIPTGNGNELGTKKYCGVLGSMLDPYDKENSSEPVAKYPMQPITVKKAGNKVTVKYNGPPLRKSNDSSKNYRDFVLMLKRRGKTDGENIIYPKNFWKNAHVIFRTEVDQKKIENDYLKLPKVLSSDSRTITLEGKYGGNNQFSTFDTFMQILSNKNNKVGFWIDNHWERDWCQHTVMPECSEWAMTEIRPRTYFRVYVGNNSYTPPFFKGNSEMLDCDGDPAKYSETEEYLLKWEYKEAKPIRSDAQGVIDVIVTSSRECNKKNWRNEYANSGDRSRINKTKSYMDNNMFIRPDIVELINVSDKPVSIAGWRVMINTGSLAKELCRIDSTTHYEKQFSSLYEDKNPIVPPRGYAYLTSDREIFDIEYGSSKNGVWGDSAKEEYSCYELPQDVWGVWYKIEGFKPATRNLWSPGNPGSPDNNIILEGADFVEGELVGEMIEFRSERSSFKGNDLNGYRRIVTGNTKNALEILYGQAENHFCDLKAGDYVVILGIPRTAGFLSLTLRNEYNQITSRTLEYGSTEYDEFDVSCERPDPTVFDVWAKTKKPSFGGNFNQARSRNIKKIDSSTVLNRPIGSIAELLEVSSGKVNLSFKNNEADAADFLKTIGPAITLNMIRFDAESDGAFCGNNNSWKSTEGTISSSQKETLSIKGKKWEPGLWKNQTLNILSGKMRGEQFKIDDNSTSVLNIKGLSTKKRKQLSVSNGDKCSVGPAYKTPLFYTRTENAKGIWEWKNTGIDPNSICDLYLFGLNDSIKTTEFLEENHNAQLAVKIWNFKNNDWDKPNKKRHKYDKNDSIFFGRLNADNIGDKGAIKISISAHNLADEGCSGLAWLDYILLTPVEKQGKININTASEKVLAALPAVNNKLAQNIVNGISGNNKNIRPYKNIYDLLNVKGMSVNILCKISEYLTVRTDTYRINVTAQIFAKPPIVSKVTEKNIAASQKQTFVVVRKADNNNNWEILQKENISIN